jgi:hypothetical protein
MLNRPAVLVADPQIIHEIAVKQVYDFVKPAYMLGNLIAIAFYLRKVKIIRDREK